MLKVGLTGGIGSGKSTVAKVFEVLGVPVFRADDVARRLQDGDPDVKQAIGEAFGGWLYASGKLDRAALAHIVFHDRHALAKLNAIVHPATRRAFQEWCGRQTAPYVVMEAAILTESGGAAAFDQLVVVSAPEDVRLQRVMARDEADREAVLARMRNQVDEAARLANADHVIRNDGTSLLIPQVLDLHRRFNEA
jgi:dephospho-CoA kinase